MELLTASRRPRCLERCRRKSLVSGECLCYSIHFCWLKKYDSLGKIFRCCAKTSKCCSRTMAGIGPEPGNAATNDGHAMRFLRYFLEGIDFPVSEKEPLL